MDDDQGFQLNIEEARLAHGRRRGDLQVHANQVEAFALSAMRAPALAAAGGIAAILAFASANFERIGASSESILSAVFWLFVCLMLTVVAPGSAYLSQIAYTNSISKEEWNFDHPYYHDTGWSKFYGYVGDGLRWLTVALVIAAYFALAKGGYLFLQIALWVGEPPMGGPI